MPTSKTVKCKNPDCLNLFSIKLYDPKVFCSKSCATHFNNLGRKLSRETKLKIANSLSQFPITKLKSEMEKKAVKHFKKLTITKEQLNDLYWNKKFTASEIATKMGVSVWSIFKRMKKLGIVRRTSAESNNIKYMNKPPSYRIKTNMSPNEKSLYNSLALLYWAEGAKKNAKCVNFANSDWRMIKLFLTILRRIFRIDESRLRVGLYYYADQDPVKLKSYWSRLLGVPEEKFIKPYLRNNSNPEKAGRMPNGLARIIYHDKKLLMQIMSEIDKIALQIS